MRPELRSCGTTEQRSCGATELRRSVALSFFSSVLLLSAAPSHARTISLKGEDADRMAALAAEAPRQGWASYPLSSITPGEGIFTGTSLYLTPEHGFLIRYPLDKIPEHQKITHVEWTIRESSFSPGTQARLYVWRMLSEWGAGVCYLYRMMLPKPVEWAAPGARGNSLDRATRPSAVAKVTTAGTDQVFNVTEDTELWYTKAAPNHGWLLSVEEKEEAIALDSPLWVGSVGWELRITYEPQ